LSWGDAADDELIEDFVTTVNADITTQLKVINATRAYNYLNDADQDQDVFQGYPAANVEMLKIIHGFDARRIQGCSCIVVSNADAETKTNVVRRLGFNYGVIDKSLKPRHISFYFFWLIELC